MIAAWRSSAGAPRPLGPAGESSIVVAVRKRPISAREIAARDYDAISIVNPSVVVHAPRLRVDGITKYLDNAAFSFDYAFGETATTADVYSAVVSPLLRHAVERHGRSTVLAYGQTGSGKTFTTSGLQQLVARDIFRAAVPAGLAVHVSFLELHGARCVDLLHGGAKVSILEDERKRVVCSGLAEVVCASPEELLALVARGAAERSTHATEVNASSSRSHAILEIVLRSSAGAAAEGGTDEPHGSISIVDLAGSERAADVRNHNAARRVESAEINKSLLALKECIRALAARAAAPADAHVHVPFRASKLTLVLRDSFTAAQARLAVIATVSPNASSASHSTNTLLYADRVKERTAGGASAVGDGDDGTFDGVLADSDDADDADIGPVSPAVPSPAAQLPPPPPPPPPPRAGTLAPHAPPTKATVPPPPRRSAAHLPSQGDPTAVAATAAAPPPPRRVPRTSDENSAALADAANATAGASAAAAKRAPPVRSSLAPSTRTSTTSVASAAVAESHSGSAASAAAERRRLPLAAAAPSTAMTSAAASAAAATTAAAAAVAAAAATAAAVAAAKDLASIAAPVLATAPTSAPDKASTTASDAKIAAVSAIAQATQPPIASAQASPPSTPALVASPAAAAAPLESQHLLPADAAPQAPNTLAPAPRARMRLPLGSTLYRPNRNQT